MKSFEQRDLRAALEHAASGGQALHLHRIIADTRKAPKCFKDAVARGDRIAHLFDLDRNRLIATVRKLGVRIVHVEREGTPKQHVDLCGKPLQRAIDSCED